MEVRTFVDPVNYNRISNIKESVDNALREQLKQLNSNLDWSTETITTILHKVSNFKCEDTLEVIMNVEELIPKHKVFLIKNGK